MALTRRTIVWVDANGRTTQTLPVGSASLAGVQAALLAASNADILNESEGALVVTAAPSPVVAQYLSVSDRAVLEFQTGAATIVRLGLPAPQAAIFLSDQQTVNAANPLIAAIITAATAVLTDGAGNPVVTFIGGTRDGR